MKAYDGHYFGLGFDTPGMLICRIKLDGHRQCKPATVPDVKRLQMMPTHHFGILIFTYSQF